METHCSSEPEGNLTITFDPVLSSVSLRGRNLGMIVDLWLKSQPKSLPDRWRNKPADNLDGVLSCPLRYCSLLLHPRHCFNLLFCKPEHVLSFHSTFDKSFDNFQT